MTEEAPKIELAPSEALDDGDLPRFRALLEAHPEHTRHADGTHQWFMFAAAFGHLDFVEYLVEAGADVNEPTDRDSVASPEGVVVSAADNGHLEVVRWLLDRGAVVNHEVKGQTRCYALTRSARAGHLEVVKLLVERGAAVNAVWADMTPLDYAEVGGRADVAAYLRSVGGKTADELAAG